MEINVPIGENHEGNVIVHKSPLRRVLFSVIFVVLSCHPAIADLATGKALYGQGNYSAAFKELVPLAKKGDAEARYYLGYMYSHGQGIPKNTYAAAQWFSMAASQGHGWAQLTYAGMCADGLCGGRDEYNPYEALKWFKRAATNTDPQISRIGQNGVNAMQQKIRGYKLSTEELLLLIFAGAVIAGADGSSGSSTSTQDDLACGPFMQSLHQIYDMMWSFSMKCTKF